MRREWRNKILTAFCSAGVAALAASAAAESYLRITQPVVTPDTERANELQYETTLLARHAFPQMAQRARDDNSDAWAELNELGYRGRSFAVPKREGTIRVVILGGSAVFDIHASEGQDWPHLVEENLRAVHGLTSVEVINAGTPGHATWDLLGRLYGEIWMFQPDYLVIYEEWNDIKYFSWLTPSRTLLRGYPPPPAVEFANRRLVWNPFLYYTGPIDRLLSHSQLYVHLRRRYWWWRLGVIGPEGLLVRTNGKERPGESSFSDSYEPWGPKQYELNLRLIASAARDIGAMPIFLTQARVISVSNDDQTRRKIPYYYVQMSRAALVRAFGDCDKSLLHAAEAENVRVLDLAQMFSGRPELFVDHVHTSRAGSEMIAATVAEFLAGVMAEHKRSADHAPPK